MSATAGTTMRDEWMRGRTQAITEQVVDSAIQSWLSNTFGQMADHMAHINDGQDCQHGMSIAVNIGSSI